MNLTRKFLIASVLLLSALLLGICLGSVRIPVAEVLRSVVEKTRWSQILWNVRFPRVLLSVIAGAGLSVVGNAFQGLLKNPLVDPYLLGISSGASFGAVVAIFLAEVLNASFLREVPTLTFAFGIVAALLALILARRQNTVPVTELILSGVLINILFSAATVLFVMLAKRNITHVYMWLFGTFSGTGWRDIPVPLLSVAGFTILTSGLGMRLNAMSLGETEAMTSGVEVEKLKMLVYITGTFTTAAIVSRTGMIGFVGLIVPHMARRIFGNDHRISIPTSAVLGGLLLCTCDVISRTALSPSEIPVGVITAFVGAPVMFVLLRRSGRSV